MARLGRDARRLGIAIRKHDLDQSLAAVHEGDCLGVAADEEAIDGKEGVPYGDAGVGRQPGDADLLDLDAVPDCTAERGRLVLERDVELGRRWVPGDDDLWRGTHTGRERTSG